MRDWNNPTLTDEQRNARPCVYCSNTRTHQHDAVGHSFNECKNRTGTGDLAEGFASNRQYARDLIAKSEQLLADLDKSKADETDGSKL